ncbi:putative transcription factor rap1 protein [Botrytis fragariae]|uniref:DNA-binding protein RAP1 n=1 Tax=Botrytis fragariae TaxID=1964551 RepID=A0A8H6AQK9_9HELO|nr:putative transcription factor rap1 protein [Botrytis fragariae]KAF5871550.1 putative transcription factor rap1 protein [Botrytis fragariae]
MASIVYDGIGGGGVLFEGMKFFILQRVPMRSRWVEIIRSNGGGVEKIEKNAEIIIADGARKDAPPGSISWKFIEESAKAGKLVDMEEYRCGASERASERPFAQPAKSTRTPFTAEDDRILTQWVLEGERMGRSTKGNQLYIELAERYPRHTYQSWLDHWKRHLLPSYEAGNLHYKRDDNLPCPSREPKYAKKGLAKPLATRVSHERAQSALSTAASTTSTNSLKGLIPEAEIEKVVVGGLFTKEDDDLLRDVFEAICNIDSSKEIEAWELWTEEYGRHSAQEWRNYFHEDFRPREMKNRKKTTVESVSSPSIRQVSDPPSGGSTKDSTQTNNSTKKPERTSMKTTARSSAMAHNAESRVDPKPKTSEVSTRTKHSPYKQKKTSPETAIESSVTSSGNVKQRSDSNLSTPEINAKTKNSTPQSKEALVKTTARNSVTPSRNAKPKVDQEPKIPEAAPQEFDLERRPFMNSLTTEEDYFTLTLKQFCEEDQEEPIFNPRIRGKQISLFRLWQIVIVFGGFETINAESQWQEVADKLSFPIANRSEAAQDLKSCYDEILSEFERVVTEEENDPQSILMFAASQDETLIASQLADTTIRSVQRFSGHERDVEDDDEVIELPPLKNSKQFSTMSTKKRAIGSDGLSNLSESSEINPKRKAKRIRADKGKGKEVEIPSTPEHIFNATQPPRHISPLKYQINENDNGGSSEDDSDREARERILRIQQKKPRELIRKASAKNLTVEPETQDFYYPDIDNQAPPVSPTPVRRKRTPGPIIDLSRDSSAESEAEADSQDIVDIELAKYIALGYSEDIIYDALMASTYDFDIASPVMNQLQMGHGIPDDLAGVWTQRDDDALERRKGKEYERVREKHGDERIHARIKFLRNLSEIDQ